MGQRKASHRIEEILEECNCLDNLESLVREDCDRDYLLVLLGNLQWGKENRSWESFAGMDDPRDLKALAGKIGRLATEIIVLNRTPMMLVYGPFMVGKGSWDLPAMLMQYAATLKALSRVAGPRKHSIEELTRCLLIAYVRVRTKGIHDEEVSALISAVTDECEYDATAHKAWRQRHRPAVEVALKALEKFPQ